MNKAITQVIGSFNLGRYVWVRVAVLSVLLGFLAAIVIPVHVH